MKKIVFLAIGLLSFSAIAQEGPVISSAIIAIDRNKELAEAKKFIDEAAEIVSAKPIGEIKEKDLSKFYYYQGLINYRVYLSENEALKASDPKVLDKALEGFTNLLEFEQKVDRERYTKQAKEQLQYVANDIAKRAIAASKAEDYAAAYDDFLKTYEIKKSPVVGILDTAMLYNAAIMAQNAKMYDKALEIYQDLNGLGYKGVTYSAKNAETGEEAVFPNKRMMENMVNSGKFVEPKAEGDLRPDIMVSISNLALADGDTALYETTVAKGREMFPENKSLIQSELAIYFTKKQYDKALGILDLAIDNSEGEQKVVMYYNKGVILQNEMKRTTEALAAYDEALKLDSTYSDANYMSSIIYIDSANAISDQMNELPLNATTKYEKLKKQQKKVFEVALPYLERAYASSPEDQQVIRALRQVYRQLRMFEKAQALPTFD
jgi:tetratricopeptide (TPR) repeat protein